MFHISDYFNIEMVYFRWIYHHYCAMVMALMSLTWEIKGQPDCATKQVCANLLFLLPSTWLLYITCKF